MLNREVTFALANAKIENLKSSLIVSTYRLPAKLQFQQDQGARRLPRPHRRQAPVRRNRVIEARSHQAKTSRQHLKLCKCSWYLFSAQWCIIRGRDCSSSEEQGEIISLLS